MLLVEDEPGPSIAAAGVGGGPTTQEVSALEVLGKNPATLHALHKACPLDSHSKSARPASSPASDRGAT